jgi:ABC-type spermidine/putrescine transport system permease subunit I
VASRLTVVTSDPKTADQLSLEHVARAVRPWSTDRHSALLLFLPALTLGVFFFLPLLGIVIRSLFHQGVSLDNYRRVLTDSSSVQSLIYTFRTAFTVTVAALILSYPVAYVVSRVRGGWLSFALAVILIPFWTSSVIRTYAWIVFLERHGILNELLMAVGITSRPLRLMSNGIGTQIAMIHIMLPFMLLPLLSTMRSIDQNLIRAGSVLGANPFRQFLHIFLPLSLPGVTAGCLLVFISSLGFYITPALIGAPNMMIAVLIEQQASRLLDWPLASALATVLLLLTCALFIAYEAVMRKLQGGKAIGEA